MGTYVWIAAILTVLLGMVLGVQMGRKYGEKHRPYAMWWTVSFFFAALAAMTQVWGLAAGGFPDGVYRAYLFFSAGVPGFMGAGTVYLIWRRFGHVFLGIIWVSALLALFGALTTPIDGAALTNVLVASATVAKVASSGMLTAGYALLGGFGGLALIVGALYSYVRSRQNYNLLIALGGIVFSVADTVGQFGHGAFFFPAEIIGMGLLYLGVAGSREVPQKAVVARGA